MGAVNPVSSFARQEKREITRSESRPHFGQSAFSPDWLIGRNISNLDLHDGQLNS